MSDKKKTKPTNNPRVLLLRNAYSSQMGGAEVFVYNLASELQRNGVYAVVSTSQKTLRNKCRQAHIENVSSMWAGWLQQLSGLRNLLLVLWFPYLMVRIVYLTAIIVRHKINVVHAQSRDDFIAGTWAAMFTGPTLIWSDHADLKHNFVNHDVWYKNIPGKIVYSCARKSGCPITVVSKSDLRAITKLIGHSLHTQLRVVHNGVIDVLSSLPAPDTDNTVAIGFVGRLVRDKGIYELASAYQKLRQKHDDIRLVIVGDGPARVDLEVMKLPHATFTGYTDKPLPLMRTFDIFAYPTYHEGLSLSLLEASMMQLCIVTTDVGGNPEIVTDGENGLLIAPKNIDVLVIALERCISNRKLRNLLASHAREKYLREFNFANIVKTTFMELYTT